MKHNFRYKPDLLPFLLILLLIMVIPLALFYHFYDLLVSLGWNTPLLEWIAIVIYTPVVLHLFYIIFIRFTFKIIIKDDYLTIKKLLTKKAIPFNEIAGFIIEKGNFFKEEKIYFLKNDERNSLLFAVNSDLLINKSEFFEHIFHHFHNLSDNGSNYSAFEMEKSSYYAHHNEGPQSEREKHFKSIKKLSWAFWALGLVTLIFPLFNYLPVILLIFPALFLFLINIHRGHHKIFRSPGGFYPYTMPGILLFSTSSLIYGVSSMKIAYNPLFWTVFVSFGFIFFIFLLRSTSEFKNQDYGPLPTAFLAILTAMYSYGFTTALNAAFESAAPKNYTTEILKIEKNAGLRKDYNIFVQPFGPFKNPAVSARKSFVRSVDKGSKIRIVVHEGLLKSPWYYSEEWLN